MQVLLLVVLFSSSFCLGKDTHAPTTRVQLAHERAKSRFGWKCGPREGSAAGAELGSSFVPPGEAQCGGSGTALATIWSRNTLQPCTWVMVQASCVEKFTVKLFLSAAFLYLVTHLLFLSAFFASVFSLFTDFSFTALSVSPSISNAFCCSLIPSLFFSLVQERSSTTWLHMEE